MWQAGRRPPLYYQTTGWRVVEKEQLPWGHALTSNSPADVQQQAERLQEQAPLALMQEFLHRNIDVLLEDSIGNTRRVNDDPDAAVLEHEQPLVWNHGLMDLVERQAVERIVDYYVKRLRDMGYATLHDRSVACPTLVLDSIYAYATQDLYAQRTAKPLQDVPAWAKNRPASQTQEEASLFKWRNDQHLMRLRALAVREQPAKVPGVMLSTVLRVLPMRTSPGVLSHEALHLEVEGEEEDSEGVINADEDDLDLERRQEREEARKAAREEHEKLLEQDKLELEKKTEHMSTILEDAREYLSVDDRAKFLSIWEYYEYMRDVAQGRRELLDTFEAGLFADMDIEQYSKHLQTLADQHAVMEAQFRERRIRMDDEAPLHKRLQALEAHVVEHDPHEEDYVDNPELYEAAMFRHALWVELEGEFHREREQARDARDRIDEDRLYGMLESMESAERFMRLDIKDFLKAIEDDESLKHQEEDIRKSESMDELRALERDVQESTRHLKNNTRRKFDGALEHSRELALDNRWPESVKDLVMHKLDLLRRELEDRLDRSAAFLERLVQERREALREVMPEPTVKVEATLTVVAPEPVLDVQLHEYEPETLPDAESADESESESEPEREPVVVVERKRQPLPNEIQRNDSSVRVNHRYYSNRLTYAIIQGDRGQSAKGKAARVNASFGQIMAQLRSPYARPLWTDVIKPILVASSDLGSTLRAQVGQNLQNIVEQDIGVRNDHFKRDGQLSDAIVASLLVSMPPGNNVFSALRSYLTPDAIKELKLVNRIQQLRKTVIARLSLRSQELPERPSEEAQVRFMSAVLDMNEDANNFTQAFLEHLVGEVVPELSEPVSGDQQIRSVLYRVDTFQTMQTLREPIQYKDVWFEDVTDQAAGSLYHKRLFAVERVRVLQTRTRSQGSSQALLTADEKRGLVRYFDEHSARRQDDQVFQVPGMSTAVIHDEWARWQRVGETLAREVQEETDVYLSMLEDVKERVRAAQGATNLANNAGRAIMDELVQNVSRASNTLFAIVYKYALVEAARSLRLQLLSMVTDQDRYSSHEPLRFYEAWKAAQTVDRNERRVSQVKEQFATVLEVNADTIDSVLSVIAQPELSMNDRNVLLLETLALVDELAQVVAREA